jgi:glycosyltransferase involved in cell wall biosynthesis
MLSNSIEGHGAYVYHKELQTLFEGLPSSRYSVVFLKNETLAFKGKQYESFDFLNYDVLVNLNGLYSLPYYIGRRHQPVPIIRDYLATAIWAGVLQEILYLPLSSDSDVIVCPSKFGANALKRISDSAQSIVFNGVLFPKHIYRHQKQKRKKTRILYLGRVTSDKNVSVLFEIIQRVLQEEKNVELLIVGPTYGKVNVLEAFCTKYDLKNSVIFREFVTETEKWELLCNSDFMLFPSVSAAESGPRVLIEALFAGLPVIATNWSGIPEIIHHGKNGYLVNIKVHQNVPKFTTETLPFGEPDIAEMVEYSLKLIKNPELREKMGMYAKELSSEFSLSLNFNSSFISMLDISPPVTVPCLEKMGDLKMQNMNSVFSERFLEFVDFGGQTYREIVKHFFDLLDRGIWVPSYSDLKISIADDLWFYLLGLSK